jgi:sugar lactone lactonase YvrE
LLTTSLSRTVSPLLFPKFTQCSQAIGITFSPDGQHAYVTDTGIVLGFYGRNLTSPSSVYQFDVNKDGTFGNRKTFAYTASFIPDGKLLPPYMRARIA